MPAADIILRNANVITMDAVQPVAEMVAVDGDRISLVGDIDNVELAAGANTRVIDCQGKTVVPGFNDAHMHLFSFIRKLLSIDLSPTAVKSINDIKTVIRRKAESTPKGTWLYGTDFNEYYLAEKRFPTRRDIDEVAPEHPVVLSHRSLHACVLNSRALELAGINQETPEPEGARIERDLETGEPNGILYEMLGYVRGEVMPAFTEAEQAEGVSLANKQLLSQGITSLQEATVSNDLKRWYAVEGFKESGRLRSRVIMMAGMDSWEQFREAGLTTGAGDDQLRMGAVKVMVTETTGAPSPPPEKLKRLVLDCQQAGFQLAIHVEEEDVIASVIEALEYVDGREKIAAKRHRIEHCAECPPYLLERLSRLGVVIVTQPPFIYYSGERYLVTVEASQLPWLYRIKAPIDSGLVVAGSSDVPVVPHNPLVGIYAAVTRQAASGQALLPEEAISPQQALAMYTVNAAYAAFEEDVKGSVTPGKLADMAVLSDDPTRVSSEEIKDIRVEMTIIGGEVVWEG